MIGKDATSFAAKGQEREQRREQATEVVTEGKKEVEVEKNGPNGIHGREVEVEVADRVQTTENIVVGEEGPGAIHRYAEMDRPLKG